VARSVLDYFRSPAGQQVLKRMQSLGIAPQGSGPGSQPPGAGSLAGKTFVLTGSLEKMTRTEATERIRALGGNVTGSVTKKTDWLVAGENAGSKLDDARALQISILSESALLELLEGPARTTRPHIAAGAAMPGQNAGGDDACLL
jgi:DNA ligase (NAD+)